MIDSLGDLHPRIDPTAFVHSTAVIIADVVLGPRASVWPGVVLRGDHGFVHVGEETNIQDGTIAHGTGGVSTTTIGPRVTVGHRALLHGCHVVSDALVGMGAILLDNCVIEPWCVVGAGALVPVGRRIPSRSLVMGTPARVVRQLSDQEIDHIIGRGHREYLALMKEYQEHHG